MTPAEKVERLEKEQNAFDEKLDAMLEDHPGAFVVFRDGEPVGFFESFEGAYRDAVSRFGIDDTFLVSQVREFPPIAASLSWEAGVLV
jgi:hypothetical protein